jgi:hypothetical protein
VYEVKNLPDFPEKLEAFKAMDMMQAPVVEANGVNTFAGFNPDRVAEVVALHGLGNQ